MTATHEVIVPADVSAAAEVGVPRANWRRVLGLQEMGVFYALGLLITVLSVITSAKGQANYLALRPVPWVSS